MHHSITTIEIERTTSLNPKINLKKIRAVSAGAGGWAQVEGWRRGSAGEAWSSVCERWHWVKGSEKWNDDTQRDEIKIPRI